MYPVAAGEWRCTAQSPVWRRAKAVMDPFFVGVVAALWVQRESHPVYGFLPVSSAHIQRTCATHARKGFSVTRLSVDALGLEHAVTFFGVRLKPVRGGYRCVDNQGRLPRDSIFKVQRSGS